MSDSKNKVIETPPIVFMIFNRPDYTRAVFAEIRKAQPKKLFIVADGPRTPSEEAVCKETRAVVETIDWPCELHRNYAEKNLGLKERFRSGLNWFFENVEEGIILEDDCLPHPSFFKFAGEMLERYRNNEQIMMISGDNFLPHFKIENSYCFSKFFSIWGWATWRRAWQYYDVNVANWPQIKKDGILLERLHNPAVVNHYNNLFDQYYTKAVDSWDSPWFLARWVKKGLSIVPKNNLVSNIGFDNEAAHKSIDPEDSKARIPVMAVDFPLQYPDSISVNTEADNYVFKYYLDINRFFGQRLRWFIKQKIPILYSFLKNSKEKIKNA